MLPIYAMTLDLIGQLILEIMYMFGMLSHLSEITIVTSPFF